MSLTDILKHPMAAAAGAGLGLVVALTPVKATMQDNKPKVEYAQAQAEERAYYSESQNLEKLLPANYSVRKTVDVDKNNVRFIKNDREYVQIVKDDEGNPIMRVEVEYIGKRPKMPVSSQIQKLAQKRDVDFYDIIFRNISNQTIEFLQLKYWGERGELVTPRFNDKSEIKASLGTDTLVPNNSVNRRNSYVFSNVPNVIHREYEVKADNGVVRFDVPNLYQ